MFLFKQKAAYYRRISDWSSDVCSSDLTGPSKRAGRYCAIWPEKATIWLMPPCPISASTWRASAALRNRRFDTGSPVRDRKSAVLGKSVSVRVDLGGSRIIKKKNKTVEII